MYDVIESSNITHTQSLDRYKPPTGLGIRMLKRPKGVVFIDCIDFLEILGFINLFRWFP